MTRDLPPNEQAGSGASEMDGAPEDLALTLWNEGRKDEAVAILERRIAAEKTASPHNTSGAADTTGRTIFDGVSAAAALPAVSYQPGLGALQYAFSGGIPLRSSFATADTVPAQNDGEMEAGPQPASTADDEQTPRRRSRRPGRVIGALAGLALLVLLGAGFWVGWGLQHLDLDRPPNPRPFVMLEAADGTPITQSGGSYAGPVTRAELPDHLVQAVLAIEDRRFYDHFGFDVIGIMRAAWRNLRAGGIVEGGSTITQQLAKVLFLHPEQTLRRKLQDAVVATWLDLRLTKDEILAKYLDSIYFGAGATGITAAAKIYFDKPVSDLTLAESAMLAGLLQAPSRLNPLVNPSGARERAALVLNAMVDAGFIARGDALAALLVPAAPVRNDVAQTGSWFGDWVHGAATGAMGPLAGAARIRTTLQPRLQAIAENAVRTALSRHQAGEGSTQAALVAMSADGAIVAMVGGRSYEADQLNRAVAAPRPPGSAFSIAVYLAALRLGWDLDDVLVEAASDRADAPSGTAAAPEAMTLEQEFVRSRESATLLLAEQVGAENIVMAARDLGIEAELPTYPAVALGAAPVTLLDLTGAYASIAAGRFPLEPWAIAAVSEDAVAQTGAREGAGNTRELAQAEDMRRLLRAALIEGSGGAIGGGGAVAGKSGESADAGDGWFIGDADGVIAGVWVGRDDNAPLSADAVRELPAEIWRSFMAKATGFDLKSGPLPQAPEPDAAPSPAEGQASEPLVAGIETDANGAGGANGNSAPGDDVTVAAASAGETTAPAAAPATGRAMREARLPRSRPGSQPIAAAPAAVASRAVRTPAAPEPQAVRRPVRTQPQVARRTAAPQPRMAPDGPRILLGGRGFGSEDGASTRSRGGRTAQRNGAAERPTILLGGRGLP